MKQLLPVLTALATTAASTSAAVIAEYKLPSGDPASSDTELNSTAGDLGNGTGFTPVYDDQVAYGNSQQTGSAYSSTDAFIFIVTPDSGFQFNLTSLTFGTAFFGDQVVAGNASFVVRSSVDGFAADIGSTFAESTYQQTTTGGPPYPLPTFTPRTVDLSGAAFQNLTDPVTFRIHFYDSTSSSERFDAISDIALNGDVVMIPEPTVFSLAAIAFAGLFIRKRRS